MGRLLNLLVEIHKVFKIHAAIAERHENIVAPLQFVDKPPDRRGQITAATRCCDPRIEMVAEDQGQLRGAIEILAALRRRRPVVTPYSTMPRRSSSSVSNCRGSGPVPMRLGWVLTTSATSSIWRQLSPTSSAKASAPPLKRVNELTPMTIGGIGS